MSSQQSGICSIFREFHLNMSGKSEKRQGIVFFKFCGNPYLNNRFCTIAANGKISINRSFTPRHRGYSLSTETVGPLTRDLFLRVPRPIPWTCKLLFLHCSLSGVFSQFVPCQQRFPRRRKIARLPRGAVNPTLFRLRSEARCQIVRKITDTFAVSGILRRCEATAEGGKI